MRLDDRMARRAVVGPTRLVRARIATYGFTARPSGNEQAMSAAALSQWPRLRVLLDERPDLDPTIKD